MDLSGAIHGKLWGETGYIWGSKWFKWGWIRFNILAVVWTESMFGYHHWVEILPVVFSNPMSVEACQWLETHSGVWLISRNSAFGKPLRSLKPPRNQYPRKWLEKHPWMAQCTLRGAGRIYKYKDISWNYNMDIYIWRLTLCNHYVDYSWLMSRDHGDHGSSAFVGRHIRLTCPPSLGSKSAKNCLTWRRRLQDPIP